MEEKQQVPKKEESQRLNTSINIANRLSVEVSPLAEL